MDSIVLIYGYLRQLLFDHLYWEFSWSDFESLRLLHYNQFFRSLWLLCACLEVPILVNLLNTRIQAPILFDTLRYLFFNYFLYFYIFFKIFDTYPILIFLFDIFIWFLICIWYFIVHVHLYYEILFWNFLCLMKLEFILFCALYEKA